MIWSRLGNVSNYIEPFFGSGAVLLSRPHPPKIETLNDSTGAVTNAWRATDPLIGNPDLVADYMSEIINDLDPFIANAWRSIKESPEETAAWADQPVHELSLHAMHRWLVRGEGAAEFRERMRGDPEYYDPRRAGYWITGACMWIGSGWCTDSGVDWDKRPTLLGWRRGDVNYGGFGVHADKVPDLPEKRPLLLSVANEHGERTHYGLGVHGKGPGLPEKIPYLTSGGDSGGVHAKGSPDAHRPQLADAYSRGRGVHSNDSVGTCATRRAWLLDWFGRLRDRLRTVRVCCGDWKRVCSSRSVTTQLGSTGLFLDAPYKTYLSDGRANRSGDLYGNDCTQDVNRLVDDVIAYCIERGSDPLMRIAACCYEGEGYEVLVDHGWECVAWRTAGGYANRSKGGNENASRERIYFSPACLKPGRAAGYLFDL